MEQWDVVGFGWQENDEETPNGGRRIRRRILTDEQNERDKQGHKGSSPSVSRPSFSVSHPVHPVHPVRVLRCFCSVRFPSVGFRFPSCSSCSSRQSSSLFLFRPFPIRRFPFPILFILFIPSEFFAVSVPSVSRPSFSVSHPVHPVHPVRVLRCFCSVRFPSVLFCPVLVLAHSIPVSPGKAGQACEYTSDGSRIGRYVRAPARYNASLKDTR